MILYIRFYYLSMNDEIFGEMLAFEISQTPKLVEKKRKYINEYIMEILLDIIVKYDTLETPIINQNTRIYYPRSLRYDEMIIKNDGHLIRKILEQLFPTSEFYVRLSCIVDIGHAWYLTFSYKDYKKLLALSF